MLQFIPFDDSLEHYQQVVDIHNRFWQKYPQTVRERQIRDATREPRHVHYRWLVYLDHLPVALLDIGMAQWSPDPHKFEFLIVVLPEYRRRGIGSAALKYATDYVLSHHDAQIIETEANTLDPAGIAFLSQHGFEVSTKENGSSLDLAVFDKSVTLFDTDVQCRSYAELNESDLDFWPRLHALHTELERDVPWHDEVLIEPLEQWKRLRAGEPTLLLDGGFVAIGTDGKYVGVTELFLRPAQDQYLHTGLTGVLKSYRRQGIATVLKCLSLNWAKDHLRTKTGQHYMVLTENEVNNPMFTLNQSLGFTKLFEFFYYSKSLKGYSGEA